MARKLFICTSFSVNLSRLSLSLLANTESLRAIEPRFIVLKENYEAYTTHLDSQGKTYYTFTRLYPKAIETLKEQLTEARRAIAKESDNLEAINVKISHTNREIGKCGATLVAQRESSITKKAKLAKITPYDTPIATSQLKKDISTLTQKLQTFDKLKQNNQTPEDLANHIERLSKQCFSLDKKITKYDDLLIHHLSEDPQIKHLLHGLLSEELLHSHKKALKKSVTTIGEEMNLFDGIIDITALSISERPFTTIEELRAQLKAKQQDLQYAQQLQKDQEAYQRATDALKEKNQLLYDLDSLPQLKEAIKQLAKEVALTEKALKSHNDQLAKEQAAMVVHDKTRHLHQRKHAEHSNQRDKYSQWAEALQKEAITPILDPF